MIFKKPLRSRTWYSSISASRPSEKLRIDFYNGQVYQSNGGILSSLFEGTNSLYVDEAVDFFHKAFRQCKESKKNISISLSAGSVSRTICAGVMAQGKEFKAYSWGGDNYIETKRIKTFIQKFGVNWSLINFDDFQSQEQEIIEKSQLSSNGLAPSKHYFYFYSCIASDSALFEGYGGSELFKAELSDGLWTDCYKTFITTEENPAIYLGDYFSAVAPKCRKLLVEYLMDSFGDLLININNTAEGRDAHLRYILELIPCRVFNGVFNSAIYCGLMLYEPFLWRKILSALFSNGLGLKAGTSLQDSYPGKYKVIKPKAEIVRQLYPKLLHTPLDRGFSMREAHMPELATKALNRTRNLLKRFEPKGSDFSGQYDFK